MSRLAPRVEYTPLALIPFVIVTGFLGAGKTTLLLDLMRLRRARGESSKIALLVNELGAVGIDGELLADGLTKQVELPGGCVCCALGDDLAKTVQEVIAANPEVTSIVLETTGVAEPLPIAWALERAPLCNLVRLATVVTVVDAENFVRSRPLSPAVDAQIAYADVLILTKSAGLDTTAVAAVRATAMDLAERALWYDGAQVNAAEVLDQILLDPEQTLARACTTVAQACAACGHHHDGAHHHSDASHAGPHVHLADTHTQMSVSKPDTPPPDGAPGPTALANFTRIGHGIVSVALLLENTPVDPDDLEDAVGAIDDGAVRIKGVVRIAAAQGPYWAAFHRVGPRFSSEPLPAATSGERQARIVALGPTVTPATVAEPLIGLYPSLREVVETGATALASNLHS